MLRLLVEAVEKFGPNVLGFQLATGARRWYIVRAYIVPEDTETMERVVAEIGKNPRVPARGDSLVDEPPRFC